MKTNQEILDLWDNQSWQAILDCLDRKEWNPNSLLVDPTSGAGNPMLLGAAERGLTAIVSALIKLGANVNWRDPYTGFNALLIASMMGHTAVVELLLAAGAEVNVKSKCSQDGDRGETPLMQAAGGRHEEAVRILLKAGARPSDTTRRGLTALSQAVTQSGTTLGLVFLLLDAGSRVDGRDLHFPVLFRDLQLVALLMAKQPDVNQGYDWPVFGSEIMTGDTPLLVAARDTALEAMRKAGSPLGVAKPAERLAIVEMLLAADADVNSRCRKTGFTPLILTALFNEPEIAKRLLQAGADPSREFECTKFARFWKPENAKSEMLSATKMAQRKPRNREIRQLLGIS